jgi:threonine/homoserine/homoserine lactone efflux protein
MERRRKTVGGTERSSKIISTLVNLVFSYLFSFIGSMTPGTINLSVLRSGLDHKPSVGIKMAFAAAIIEYFYAWIAVVFEDIITSSPLIVANFQLIAAGVMLSLGIITILSSTKITRFNEKFNRSGFRRGILLGILNPLAIPYWIGVTAYFKSQDWINLDTAFGLHLYLLGVSLGVFTLLVLVTFSARRLSVVLSRHAVLLKKIPGFIMLGLGLYALGRYVVYFL